MIKRVQLVNSTQQWRANGRYKVNTVVTHLGVDYQNTTGANSTPSLLTDWVVVSDTQIVDDLVTTSPSKALSANQGVELKKLIDAVVVNMTLFPTTADSDITDYVRMVTSMDDADYDDTAVNVPTGAITGADVLVSELATDAGVIFGGSGVVNIQVIGKIRKASGTANGQFYYEVYKRNLAGTETLLATSDATEIVSSNVYVEFSASAVWSNTDGFISTDRIVYKFYGSKSGSGSNPSFEFEFGGATPVRSIVPVAGTAGGSVQINYSTDEVNLGVKWIDDKPIYRTVFISYLDSNGLFVTNVPDIDSVINLHGIYSDIINFNQYILPFVRLSYTNFVITASEFGDLSYTKDGGDIVCSCSQDGVPAEGSVKIIFEYTKTTD